MQRGGRETYCEINTIDYNEWEKIVSKKNNMYILLTSGAERNRLKDIEYLEKCLEGNDSIVYCDFPFNVIPTDYPYMKHYSEETSWFYDMLYSGLALYDKNPKQYVYGVFQHNGITIKNGIFMMADYESNFVNIKNGERNTKGCPTSYENDVYICGSCIAYGDCADDSTTIASQLQKRLNKLYPNKYCVHNYGTILIPVNNLFGLVKTFCLKEGDKVFFVDRPRILVDIKLKTKVNDVILAEVFCKYLKEVQQFCQERGVEFTFLNLPMIREIDTISNFERMISKRLKNSVVAERAYINQCSNAGMLLEKQEKIAAKNMRNPFEHIVGTNRKELIKHCQLEQIKMIDLTNLFTRPHEFVEIYRDNFHLSYMGYAFIADILMKNIFMKNHNIEQIWSELKQLFEDNVDNNILTEEFLTYLKTLENISHSKGGTAGVIVMNCNPFTKGHHYLIKTAADQVDWLYVLVVEEDKSYFKFADRINMVKDGTADIDNVVVINSSKFVISSITFPEYFTKEVIKDTSFDATDDLFNFCRYICPALKVTKRFVGEEPFDVVTRRYNEQMKTYLPKYGIELIEIPRKESRGIAISATIGREYLKNGDIKGVEEIFPKTTIDYLERMNLVIH